MRSCTSTVNAENAVAMAIANSDEEKDKFGDYSDGECGENLAGDFNNIVSAKTSGLDDLNYSSDDNDDKDYLPVAANEAA